jgi:nucleoside-diphosphate-sugar epimerase
MTKSTKKILVTGGAGFIGSHLTLRLLQKGYSVTVLDNLSSGKIENLSEITDQKGFNFIQGNILDKNILLEAYDGVNAVVHLAALIDISASVIDPFPTNDINVSGTLNMLYSANEHKINRFVFASSTAVYGTTETLPINEGAIQKPISPYAASKSAGESYCNAFATCYDLDTVALRFFNVYGSRSGRGPYSGVITKFIQKALNHEILTIEGDGKQSRDFIHVDDIVQAIICALEGKDLNGQVFNVCTGVSTSVNQLVDILSKIIGKDLQVKYGPSKQGDIRESVGDPTKAMDLLGFKSKVNLQKGLEMLLKNKGL